MGNHRGSIYKLPNGTWRAVVTIDGKRLSKRLALRRDAQAWLQEINEQADRGLTYEANKTKMSDFLDGWLVSIEGILTWTTHSHYEMCVRRDNQAGPRQACHERCHAWPDPGLLRSVSQRWSEQMADPVYSSDIEESPEARGRPGLAVIQSDGRGDQAGSQAGRNADPE